MAEAITVSSLARILAEFGNENTRKAEDSARLRSRRWRPERNGCYFSSRQVVWMRPNVQQNGGENMMVAAQARNLGGAGYEAGNKVKVIAQEMRLLLDTDLLAAQAASSLIGSISPQGRAALLSALYPSETRDSAEHFAQADANADGMLDATEFASFVETQAHLLGQSKKPLTPDQLFHLSSRAAIGMIGFGITDNAIMILAGDAIQNSIGLTLGLSTLMSAGLGNAVADLVGTAFRGYIERITGKFMPELKISSVQMESKEAWWAETVGASAGVTVGCLLGLAPLLFLHHSHGGGSPPNELSAAGRNSTITKPHEEAVEHIHLTSAREDCKESAFASLSTSIVPCQVQRQGLTHNLGSSMFVLTITIALAVKRVHQFLRKREKRVTNLVVKND